MTHDEYMAELVKLKAKNLTPHAMFEAQVLLLMRNYFTSLPISQALTILVDYHGLKAVEKSLQAVHKIEWTIR